MTQFVTIDEVYAIHLAIIKRAKTKASVRDFALLHSAVERPRSAYLGRFLYPDIFAKAAAFLQSLCLNHPFTDGNKRTAWGATKRFLWINRWHLKAEAKEGEIFMIKVDNQRPDIVEISSWLKKHSRRR